jgi:hypothetical protein
MVATDIRWTEDRVRRVRFAYVGDFTVIDYGSVYRVYRDSDGYDVLVASVTTLDDALLILNRGCV